MAFLAALLLPLLVFGQAQVAPYSMFETMYITPKEGVMEQLTAKMGAHNKKYHTKAPNEARVWSVMNGKRTGQLVWSMGPTTWTSLDARPGKGEHDDDWGKTVQPLLANTENVEYWKLNTDLSYFPNQTLNLSKMRARVYTIKYGELQHFKDLRKKTLAVAVAKKLPTPAGFYENQLVSTAAGRQVAIIHFFDNWAWFDVEIGFPKLFEEVHGEGSWMQWLREYEGVVDGLEEELRELVPEMSGSTTVTIPAKK